MKPVVDVLEALEEVLGTKAVGRGLEKVVGSLKIR